MRILIFAALLFALSGTVSNAVEVRETLPFVEGRYATAENCELAKAFDKTGGDHTKAISPWHLTARGISDLWESSCQFHVVFVRGKEATAHAICVSGAETYPRLYFFLKTNSPVTHPDILVFTGEHDKASDNMGEDYIWCPKAE
jgi:hypothetical protein